MKKNINFMLLKIAKRVRSGYKGILLLALVFVCVQLNTFAQCPPPSFGNSQSACSGASISMAATSTNVPENESSVVHLWYTTSSGGTPFATIYASQVYSGTWSSTYNASLSSSTTFYVSAQWSSCGSESSSRTASSFTLTSPSSLSIGVNKPPTLCTGTSITLTPQGGSSYSWSSSPAGAGGSGAITVTPSVNTTYTLSGVESTCSTWTSTTITVTVSPSVGTVSISGSDPICQGSVATSVYTASATNATSFTWTLTAGAGTITVTSATQGTVTWNSSFTGNAIVGVTAFSGGGCSATTQTTKNVTINPSVSAPGNVGNQTYLSGVVNLQPTGAGTNEVYRWYNASSGGTYVEGGSYSPNLNTTTTYYVTKRNSVTTCESSPRIQQVITINCNSTSTFSGTGGGQLCAGQTGDVTLQGSDVATTYALYVNGSQSGSTFTGNGMIYQWPATVGNNYQVRGVSGTCGSFVSSVISFTTKQPGLISISSGNPNICTGSSLTLTAGGGSGYSWSTGQTGLSSITVSPNVQTTYTLYGTEPNCNTSVSTSLMVNVSPPVGAISITGGPNSFCQGTLTSSGYTSTTPTNLNYLSWSFTPTSSPSIVQSINATTGVVTWSGSAGTGTVTVTAFSGSYCNVTTSSSRSVSVDPIPLTPGNVTNQAVTCGIVPLNPTGASGGEVYRWYVSNVSANGTQEFEGTSYSPNLTANKTYYVSKRNPSSGCESTRVTQVITINSLATPGNVGNLTFTCGAISLSPTGAGAGEVYRWYTVPSGGTPVGEGLSYSTNLLATTTYHVSKRNNSTTCESSRVAQTITINPLGSGVVANTTAPYGVATTLSASGAGAGEVYRWYNSSNVLVNTGSTYPNLILSGAASFTFYVTRFNQTTTCETPYASKVTQVVSLYTPDPLQPGGSTNTCGDRILTFGAVPSGVAWYWQGTNSTSQVTTNPIASSSTITLSSAGPFYIRAFTSVLNTWSASVQISAQAATVDPVDLTLTSYNTSNTLVQATNSIRLLPGFNAPQGNTFNAKIAVTPECNDYINWNEQTVYNELGTAVSLSRSYYDGFGKGLQSQSKDFLSGKVFASQPLFNSYGIAVASTLPAPILEGSFMYKSRFATDGAGFAYKADDFDARTVTGASGEINNPAAMGTHSGTVGWYYSSNNNLEGQTPTTQFPYSRSLVPEGPDPTTSASAGPGDAYRMGSGHEVKSERYLIATNDLNSYYSIRSHFVQTPPGYGQNLLSAISTNTSTGFSTYQNVSIGSAAGYINAVANQSTGTPGVWPMGGSITVVPLKSYIFSVKGYRASASANANLYVNSVTNGDLVWPGTVLPVGSSNEGWVSVQFTAPVGTTQVRVGVLWSTPVIGHSFNLSGVELRAAVPDNPGYKFVSTDPNGKRAVSFVDADGRSIASAVVIGGTAPDYTYDYWSYTYYNDAGQVTATVAPKDVIIGNTTKPVCTEFKYDQLGRLIETTSPDEGMSQFVYSLNGKIRFSQNQVQRTAGPRFSYTNYDQLGRLVESGEYSFASGGYVFEPHTTTTPASMSALSILENNFTVPIDQVTSSNYTGISRKLDAVYCLDHSFITYDIPGPGSPATQTYLYGQVSKTENKNATTWYSYDEFGQLAWTKQTIVGFATKSVDYTYDYFGNVTQVAYQAGQPDKFYHHYEYDVNQRLTNVYTSLDGTTKTLQAKYKYYLHGPLKRVELAGNLQGIDYVYTINGALKSINHSDVAKDPGQDGSNGFSADVFGELINYYDNDYTGATYSAGSVSGTGMIDQFNGNIKSQSWFTPVDNPSTKKVYGYTYDNLYQLQNAQFGTLAGTAGSYTATLSANNYNENIPGYDKNGNIQSLIRNGKTGTSIGNYTYNYTAGKNQLASITGTPQSVSYNYNTIGQMIRQIEGTNVMIVAYNAYGLVKDVRDGNLQLMVSYAYDDRGNKVKKISYTSGTPSKTTYYVSDASGNTMAIYEQTTASPVLTEVPVYGAGRIALYKPVLNAWFYEVTDQLGNVRAVIGPPRTDTYTATMETEFATAEDLQFKNIAPRSTFVAANTTVGVGADEVVRLNNARPAGPGISLKVAPGDVITIETWAYYEGGSGYSNTLPLATIVNAVAGAFGGVSGAAGDPGKIYSAFNSGLDGGFAGASGSGNDGVPAGYLNMVMFDNNLLASPTTLPMSAIPVTSAANFVKQKLTIGPITIPAPGVVYIYVNNNSNSANFVNFDDLKVTHLHSPYVAGADYYPFGLTMSDREITTEPYRFGYQGQYSEEESETGWNSFDLRMYDARFGRWISPDPYGQFASPYVGMGNRPNMGVDPDGAKWIPNSLCATCGGWTTTFGELLFNAAVSVLENPGVTTRILQGAYDAKRLQKGLEVTKLAISRIAAVKAEIDFVNYNFTNYDNYSLDTDYGYNSFNLENTEDGKNGYFGFSENGFTDTREFLGKNDLFGSIMDPETGVTINVNYYGGWGGNVDNVHQRLIMEPGFNDSFVGGPGLEFKGGHADRLHITFSGVHGRGKFYDYHYQKAYRAKKAQMEKKYRLIGKKSKIKLNDKKK